MQRAVEGLNRRREIKRAGQLSGDPQRVADRCRPVFPDGEVQRIGGHIVLDQIRRDSADASRERRHQRRMGQLCGDETLELGYELVGALRRKVEFEEFDRDQALSRRIVSTIDRPQRSRADLMKNSKRSEGVGRCIASSVSVQ
jgi:hypothetical protein